VSPFPAQMQDHWVLPPGTEPDRAELMWFMRFGHDAHVTGLARLGQDKLAGLDGLDLVPAEWLHMTTLIAGFADKITVSQIETMTGRARQLLASTPPVTVTLGRILYHPRAVMLGASPAEALQPVLAVCQAATLAATGQPGRLYHDPWIPHITLAYANSPGPARPVIEALGRELPATQVTVTSVSLISQAPRQRFTWHSVCEVPLGRL
jgi:2'-5' RNA ligase